ncbi:MAG TPA: ABC transporter ATP-binding protein [Thermodesulfovibrio thiophilus]|uniref:energy-coupling factor ABC transporter ATP-binding protein n=1 Tax=Thermodesulfovibrio thiophilus TaxID=340095 RepID=UPI00040C7AEA|nr:ABC transporter ATP-binding protein [Thermodesulfovibrio thiophilus]HHW20273.1 ABC transporter ATP-binding protein [Thermodesulfovibrio thiophilus]HOA82603.1 ABC transporter ATP-binding protein [Thermodesulfovibrio thiophilus]HQD37034.1 ABC transporter ATP-binding protein [Thermodesulfovibrio thiophilus]
MKKPIIKLRNISFHYDSIEVLKNLNLEVYEGDRIGLIGPNGSGKTTLLYIIMGLLKPTSGTVEIFGKPRHTEKDFIEIRQKIGLLFQDSDSQLFCPTVKEDIAFGPLNLGKTREEAFKIVNETCELLGLKGFEDRITYKLSGGEKKLVAFATVMAMNPICYLLDEPSSGLDEETTERLLNYLRNNAQTYLLVSHDKDFINKATDKIFVLEPNKISILEKL